MPSYLVVANQTLGSRALATAIHERFEAGDATFHVVVPATPIPHRMTWDEDEARQAAVERLQGLLDRLRAMGAEADGEIGSPDPVAAVTDVLRVRDVDEVILSTLPAGVSRWLGLDVPHRLRGAVHCPVVVVTEVPEPSGAAAR
jgi:hypothetical protein